MENEVRCINSSNTLKKTRIDELEKLLDWIDKEAGGNGSRCNSG
jgi:hypothetical protein